MSSTSPKRNRASLMATQIACRHLSSDLDNLKRKGDRLAAAVSALQAERGPKNWKEVNAALAAWKEST